jgi:hypothetical protein
MENTIERNILSPTAGRLTSQKRTWSSVVLLAGASGIALLIITMKNFIVQKGRTNKNCPLINLRATKADNCLQIVPPIEIELSKNI